MIPNTQPDETIEQARRRLAQKAREHGVKLRQEADGRWYASSVSCPVEWHFVTGFSCECLGFLRVQRCMHHSALLAHLGWLPGSEPVDPDPAPLDISLISGRQRPSPASEHTSADLITVILVDGLPTVLVVGDTDELRVGWIEGGGLSDDLTDCTPSGFGHIQAVAHWLGAVICQVEVHASFVQAAGSGCSDTLADAA